MKGMPPRPSDITFTEPHDQGRLLDAEQVAQEIFDGQVSETWVKRQISAGRIKLGHRTVRWYENLVRDWLKGRVDEH